MLVRMNECECVDPRHIARILVDCILHITDDLYIDSMKMQCDGASIAMCVLSIATIILGNHLSLKIALRCFTAVTAAYTVYKLYNLDKIFFNKIT